MRRDRRVKIVATLGPASAEIEILSQLFLAGADVFRINMSHASRDAMRQQVSMIRSLEAKYRRPIGILVDLQGPKLRVAEFAGGFADLVAGRKFIFDSNSAIGTSERVFLPHPEIFKSLRIGHTVLIDDGKFRLRVKSVDKTEAVCEILVGGRITNRKGVNLPETDLPIHAITAKDRADAEAAIDAGVDWVAVSFVQRASDIADVRKIARGQALVLAKIEKPQAIARIDEIIETADALMVARGDLGVEMPLERVPGLQKRITRLARRLGKPVIIATQMLESMISNPVPTRAEVSDVATAVFEGADAIMLSAESASGQYPVQAIQTMNRIAEEVERDPNYPLLLAGQRAHPEPTGADAIAAAARSIAETVDMKAIVAWTSSGSTGLRIARERPRSPIIALTPSSATARRLALAWGIHPMITKDAHDIDDMAERACQITLYEGFAISGERILIVAGVPFGTPGATNMIRLAYI
jgi:pyruvate kinase